MLRKAPSSRKAAGILAGGALSLFGLPFFLAGLFLTGLYFSSYVKWWRALSWEEVPCVIDSANLESGNKSSSRAAATYHYRYAGRSYAGDRVSLHSGADNIGDFQRDAYRELSSHAQGKKARPFRCYVNPADPAESVIYRTLRWPLQAFMAVFALTFPAIGTGLVFGGLLGIRSMRAESRLRAANPDQRWKWKPEWTGPAIPEHGGRRRLALSSYTAWFWLMTGPLLATAVMTGALPHERTAWLLLIFPVIGLVPTWFTLKQVRHRMAVGAASFELKQSVCPGGNLQGAILTTRPLPPATAVELTLECVKSITRQSGDGSSISSEKFWSHQQSVPAASITRDSGGSRLPVVFPLPDAPETTLDRTESMKFQWNLHLKVPGTVIHSVFEIPVFRTGQALAGAPQDAPAIEVPPAELPALLAARKIQSTFDADGLPGSIVCPPARNPQMLVFFLIFDLIWTAVAVLLVMRDAPLIFLIVWPASAAAIWISVIWMAFHKRTVTLDPAGMTVSNQLGPLVWTRSYTKRDILSFSHDTNMNSGNTALYRVRLESVFGKKDTLADNLTESNTAAALAGLLEKWKTAGA